MSGSEDGHYELVLGNRQLVSGFFVLVILFAIFLTLGYILGRNSVVLSDDGTVAQQQETLMQEPEAPQEASSKPSPASAEPEPTADTPVTTTVAAAPAPKTAEPPLAVETPKPTAMDKPTLSKSEEILDARVRLITPRKGDIFVQVAAISRAEAEVMGEQLVKRGYRTFISEVPNKDLFRVLVGPFQTNDRMNEVRTKLKSEGIESIIQRY